MQSSVLKVYEWNIPSNRILSYTFLILFVYSKGSIGVLWRLGRLFGISRRLSIHLVNLGKPFSILRRSRRLIGILLQYTLTNLVDCSIFLGNPWVTLWYTWETPYTHSYTFCILGRLRILIRILKNFISGYCIPKVSRISVNLCAESLFSAHFKFSRTSAGKSTFRSQNKKRSN